MREICALGVRGYLNPHKCNIKSTDEVMSMFGLPAMEVIYLAQ
jgi:hypothetical protein